MEITNNMDVSKWSKKDRDNFNGLMEEMGQTICNRQLDNFTKAATSGQRSMTKADLDWTNPGHAWASHPFTYSCSGPVACLFDNSQPICHHEVCARFNTDDGISALEHDTVSKYTHRIRAAKTQRMKDALRKQRDCQIEKDKAVWDDWKQRFDTKLQQCSKEAYDTFYGTKGRDTKSPELLPSTTQPPEHPIISVGQALSKLQSATLSVERQEFVEFVISRIKPDLKSSSDFWWDPSSCLSYFGPVDIGHIDAAITNVCEVLNLNAALPYELDYCLRAFLKQFKDLLKHLSHSQKTFKGLTVNRALCHALDLFKPGDNAKRNYKSSTLARREIYDVLSECSMLVSKDHSKILQLADQCADTLTYPDDRFEKIKDQAVRSSPLPPVAEISMTGMTRSSKLACIWRITRKKLNDVPKTQSIQELVQQIRILANNCPSEFQSRSEYLAEVLTRGGHNRVISAAEQLTLQGLLTEAEAVWAVEADAYNEKVAVKNTRATAEAEQEYQCDPSFCVFSIDQDIAGMTRENCKELALAYCRDFILHRHDLEGSAYRYSWFKTIRKNLWRGVTEAFLAYRHFHPCSELPTLHGDLSVLFTKFSDSDKILLEKTDTSVLRYLMCRYQQGWCPAATLLRMLVFLCHVSALNPAWNKRVLQQLDWLCRGSMQDLPVNWRQPLRLLSLAIIQFYGFLIVECTYIFGRYDVDQVVMSTLWLMMAHVLVAETKQQAEGGFEYMMKFLTTVIGLNLRHIDLIKKRFHVIFESQDLRCVNLKECGITRDPEDGKLNIREVCESEARGPE